MTFAAEELKLLRLELMEISLKTRLLRRRK
jgi:hypothetical protein